MLSAWFKSPLMTKTSFFSRSDTKTSQTLHTTLQRTVLRASCAYRNCFSQTTASCKTCTDVRASSPCWTSLASPDVPALFGKQPTCAPSLKLVYMFAIKLLLQTVLLWVLCPLVIFLGTRIKSLDALSDLRPHLFLFPVETSTLHDARRFKKTKEDTVHERVYSFWWHWTREDRPICIPHILNTKTNTFRWHQNAKLCAYTRISTQNYSYR